MKQAGLIFLALVVFSSCQTKPFKHSKSDTSIIACIYIKDFSGNVYGGMAQQYVLDVEREILDSSSGEKIKRMSWVRDTLYSVLEWKPTIGPKKDTLRDSTNKPILKPYFDLNIPKQFVYPTTISIQK